MPVAEKVKARLSRFRYVPDKGEKWRSLADAVRAGGEWKDDCDGYALTAAQLAVEDFNVPRENVALGLCQTETNEGHLVCLITEDGVTRVVDNRHPVWEWSALPYKWVSAMKLSEPSVWRAIPR